MNSGALSHRNNPRAVLLFALSVFVGWLGVDRFVNGNVVLGVLKLLTVGGVGVWWVIDIVIFAVRMTRAYYASPLELPQQTARPRRHASKAAPPRPARRVGIAYRDFHEDAPAADYDGYVYAWGLDAEPFAGQRLYVRGGDGESARAVVLSVDPPLPDGYTQDELAPVFREATETELERAAGRRRREEERAAKDEVSWLNMARRATGLPVPGRARNAPPDGMPEIPPIDGYADELTAHDNARVWWRVYKRGQEAGRPVEEFETAHAIAKHWYKVAREARE